MHSIMWQLLFKLITCLQHWKINLINVIQHKLSKWPVNSFTETFFIDNLRWRILKYFETKLYLIFIVQNDKTDILILLRKKMLCFAVNDKPINFTTTRAIFNWWAGSRIQNQSTSYYHIAREYVIDSKIIRLIEIH